MGALEQDKRTKNRLKEYDGYDKMKQVIRKDEAVQSCIQNFIARRVEEHERSYVEFRRAKCFACGKRENKVAEYAKCSRCKLALYCSRACQVSHWTKHKKNCKKNF